MVEGCRAYGGGFLNHGARRWAVFSFAEMWRKLQGGFCELKTLPAALRLYSTGSLFCPQLRLYPKPGRYVEEARQTLCPPRCGPHGRTSGLTAA